MTLQANSSIFLIFNNRSYKFYTHNQLMLSNDVCFNISDSVLGDISDNLHFDKFIVNCQVINHEFSLDKNKAISDIKNLYIDNDSNEFLIACIFE